MDSVWIFNGENSRFCSSVFTDLEQAKKWIAVNKLSGILTYYPVNISVYDWAIENKYFIAKDEKHLSAKFIQGFTSASQEHYHFENGEIN